MALTILDSVHATEVDLADDLAWLDATLRLAVESRRDQAPGALPGIYVSEGEVDALLARPTTAAASRPLPFEWQSPRLKTLAALCSLEPFDQGALLLAAAPGIDQRYLRLYAYLQDDLTRQYPTPGLALDLFGGDFGARARLRSRFAPEAPLRALALVRLKGDDSDPLGGRAMQVDEAVVSYLLGQESGGGPVRAERRHLVLPPVALEEFGRLREEWRTTPPDSWPAVFIAGEPGSGRRLVAAKLATAAGLVLHTVQGLATSTDDVREAALRGAALCIADADPILQSDAGAERAALELALRHTRVPVLLTLGRADLVPATWAGRKVRFFPASPPGTEEAAAIWRQEAAVMGVRLGQEEARLLATTYRLNGGQIAAAVERASLHAGSSPGPAGLVDAAKAMSSTNLGRLGQEISPRFGWEDIVLPEEVAEVLREIILRVRHRSRVLGEWGFGARHARSRSLTALFAGPSGTGKTMAAEVIARELALPLYRVDLAAVVSKYIGETEKNLAQIFDEAASSSAVLFFDEADALFGKRSEVRDSHDRYANIEVSYLLQRMEDYDGIVILASNFRQNLDEAFVRRLHLSADFPLPNEAARLDIWRRTLPASLPLAEDVDLAALAKRFRLSGGNIRNACVTAAFLAADEAGAVTMGHFLRAVRREHQKMGKLVRGEEPS